MELKKAKKTVVVGAGLVLGALLIAPAAFAGWGGRNAGWNCPGPGYWGGQNAPPQQQEQQYRGNNRGWGGSMMYRNGYGGNAPRQGANQGWNCPGPYWNNGPQGQAPGPGQDAPDEQ